MTARDATRELVEPADTVTEMQASSAYLRASRAGKESNTDHRTP
jgi:ATP:corrinoid adenosyltransferase